jgi:superfamily II DNA or RNA helicase
MGIEILPPRDYQLASIEALHTHWSGGERRVAVVLPTGAGKTFVFAHLVLQWMKLNPGRRVLILAHTEELVMQAYADLRAIAPGFRVGIVKAARNDVAADIVIACVPSLRSAKRRAQLRRVGLMIIDECHHSTSPTYRAILAHFGAADFSLTPGATYVTAPEYRDAPAIAAGFTATLARGDNAKLSEVWESVAYRRDIGFMIRRGYLRDVTGRRIEVPDLELSKVKKSGGDYQAADLGEALEVSMAPGIVAEAILEHASDRSGVLFAPTVSAAYTFAEAMNERGIKTEVVHGALPAPERRAILERLEAGTTRWVSNCMVLTEGFNCPRVSCVAVARPTRSAPLYQQMVGRGLRLWCPTHGRHGAKLKPVKCCDDVIETGLILDVVGASKVHGLASLVDLSEKDLKEIPEDMTLIEAEEFEDEAGDDAPLKIVHDGPVEAVEFDPLDRASKFVWNRTTTGDVWFLSVGGKDGRYVFLLPSSLPDAEPDTWDVIWCSKSGYGATREQGATEHRGIPMEIAFAWAEDVADDWKMNGWTTGVGVHVSADLNTTNKRATWRKQPASQAQLTEMKRRGIAVPDGKVATTGEALYGPATARTVHAGGRFDFTMIDEEPLPPVGDVLTKGEASELIDAHAAGQRIDPIARWVESHRTAE